MSNSVWIMLCGVCACVGVVVSVVVVVGGWGGSDVMGVETLEDGGMDVVVVAVGKGFATFAVEGRWVEGVGCVWDRAASSSSR